MRLLLNLAVAALLALPLVSSPCHGLVDDKAMLEQAKEHLSDRKYYFAATWLERILKDYPSTVYRKEVLLLTIKAYNLSGRDQKAAPYVRALVKEFPKDAATLDPELLELAKNSKDATSALVPVASPPPKATAEERPKTAGATKDPAALTSPATKAKSPERPPVTPAPAQPATLPSKPAELKTAIKPPEATIPAAKLTSSVSTGSSAAQPPPPPHVPAPLPVIQSGPRPGYYAVTDALTNGKKVQVMLNKVKAAGLQPIVREETKKSEVYRLVSDCYDNRKSAEKAQASASKRNGNTFITRDADSYCIVAGSLMSEPAAIKEQKRLAGKGVQTKIVKSQVPLAISQLFIGRFSRVQEADAAVKTLAARGIAAKVLTTAD